MTDKRQEGESMAGYSETSTYYLCCHHPSWRDPLRVYTPERAQEWFDKYRHDYPVKVIEVTEQRRLLHDSTPQGSENSERPR